MEISNTSLDGCLVLQPKLFQDKRGYFLESYRLDLIHKIINKNINFVQDNESLSSYGVVRGLHMQRGKHPQAKLVRVLSGSILDVAVDIRKNSPTFSKHFSINLTSENRKQLFIPEGFLHGFSVLSDQAIVSYKCSDFYDLSSEDGVNPLDDSLAIDWKIPLDKIVISEKDQNAKVFTEIRPF